MGGQLDKAVIKVEKGMPPWIAGSTDGAAVSVPYSLSIQFRLTP